MGLLVFGGAALAADSKPTDKWWERTAPCYDPIPTEWLFHAEGTFGIQDMQGNKDGVEYEGSGLFVARKGRFSDYLWATTEKVDTHSTTGDSTDTDEVGACEEVHYDISRPVYLIAGGLYYRNTKIVIADSGIAYGGLGLFLEPVPTVRVNAEAGGGRVMQRYDGGPYSDPFVDEGLVERKINTWGWYALLRTNWAITERVGASLQARYMETPEKELKMRWVTSLMFDFMLSQHVGIQAGYKISQEDSELMKLAGLEKTDSKTMCGLKFSF